MHAPFGISLVKIMGIDWKIFCELTEEDIKIMGFHWRICLQRLWDSTENVKIMGFDWRICKDDRIWLIKIMRLDWKIWKDNGIWPTYMER